MKDFFSTLRIKYRSVPVAARASIWYTICNILQKGIAFIVIPIYVRILTTAEYGRYTTFQTWKDILIIFASLNLYCGIFTKSMVDLKTDAERDRYTSAMQGLTTINTLLFFLIYVLFSDHLNRFLDTNTFDMLLMILYFIMFPSFNFWSVRKKVENKYVSMVVITLLTSVVTPVLSLVLLYTTNMREEALIRGYLITQIVVGALFYIYHFLRCFCLFDKSYWKFAWFYNIPLIPHYLSLMILGQADRIMIKNMCGDGDAGIYSLAYSISALMNVVISAVNSAMVPWIYNKLRLREFGKISETATPVMIMMGIFTLMLTLFAPELIAIVGTSEYRKAIWVIPAVALGIYYTFCYNLYCNIEFYYNKTKYVMAASSVGAILNIILNLLLIPIFGFVAAGYTTMICYMIFMIAHYMFMKRICRIENINVSIYNDRFTVFFSVGISVLCLLIQILYPYVFFRALLFVILLAGVYINRDHFRMILNIRNK